MYTGTFQVGNIIGGGATANPGIKVHLGISPNKGGSQDVVQIGVIDLTKSQEGHFGSYLDIRDTIPGVDSKAPFSKCP